MSSLRPPFYVRNSPFPSTTEVQFRLSPSTWDDYSFRTSFDLYLVASGAEREIYIGPLKILARTYDEDVPLWPTIEKLKPEFYSLDPNEFCSLGQSVDYYARLRWANENIEPGLATATLSALNDICTSSSHPWWADSAGYGNSLLRFRDAIIAKRQARALLRGESVDTHDINAIPIAKIRTTHTVGPRTLEFRFDGNAEIPRRTCVLVGRNGTGKTTLLHDLALHLSEEPSHGKFDYDPSFSRIIFISFNAFDEQNWSGRLTWQRTSLRFVGYRGGSQALAEWLNNLSNETDRSWQERLFERFPSPESLCEQVPSYVDEGMSRLEELQKDPEWLEFCRQAFEPTAIGEALIDNPRHALTLMSAGQRVLTSLYANLYHHLDRQSLVLLDEPENHLHPSLVARFIRRLGVLLEQKRGFAIIATHSPIIVQETPSSSVFVAERVDDSTMLTPPPFETYGESIDNLNEYLFGTDSKSSAWKATLARLIDKGASLQQIEAALGGNELSSFARAYIQLLTLRARR